VDDRISARKEAVTRAAVKQGLVNEDRLLAGFLDVEGIRQTIADLKAAFTPDFTHTFASKANCLHAVLALVRDQGMGCEVASAGELHQAVAAGFPADRIVFDSPAKTKAEIRFALERGIALNIDNFQEFERVRTELEARRSASVIGFRINPQVGVGTIAAMSTATRTSKFGVALDDFRDPLLDAYKRHPWLTCIHTHVGSQGCPFELVALGVGKVAAFAEEINAAAGRRQIQVIDIGGGLPVNFESEDVRPTFAEYADNLRDGVPLLFSGRYRIVTEFGRSILAKNGFMVAGVEYTKTTGDRNIAITHAGAQTATRTVFMPDMWVLRISALDSSGRAKESEKAFQDVAGPCCFAGDVIAHNRLLPLLEPGDLVVVHDTGAYYFSTPFSYNSLPKIAVYGFHVRENGDVSFEVFREQETLEQIVESTSAP
jgi:diaminopimelate decarboxylase